MDAELASTLLDDRAEALERAALLPLRWPSRWQFFFLFAVGVLASTILLKVQNIQWLELLYLLQIGILFLHFVRRDLRALWFAPYLWLAVFFFIFMAIAMALSIYSLRFTFYLPVGLPWYASPGYVTVTRIVELFASTFILLWLADVFRQAPNKLRFTMRVYFWTGVLSAIYSYLSYFLDIGTGIQLGSYLVNHRFRGFYNEGGPYGLYLMTVLFVGFALHQLRWEPLLRLRVGLALLPVAFFKSYSKAAFSAVLLLLIINGLFTRGIAKRIAILGFVAVLAVVGARTINLSEVLSIADADASASYERLSLQRGGDPNYVYGRFAARFIIPRMIAAHPLSGIGWGNYGVLRNDPQYRGASFFADIADQPGIGILGYAAEFGIPLLTFLVLILLLPYFYLRFRRAPIWMTNLALMSPLVHLFGAQLNITYPWIMTAFALGMGYAGTSLSPQKLQPAGKPLPLSWKQPEAELGAHSST